MGQRAEAGSHRTFRCPVPAPRPMPRPAASAATSRARTARHRSPSPNGSCSGCPTPRYRLAATATPPPHGRGASKNLLGQPPNNVDATSVIQHPYNDGHRLHHHHDNTHPSISLSKNNDCQTMQQLEDELREASKSTTKFLHVSATFRKNEPRNDGSQVVAVPRSTPLSDID